MTNRDESKQPRKSIVMSIRLFEQQMDRLGSLSRRVRKSPAEAAAMLIEEGLRRQEFAFIEFRDSAAGRRACVQGSTLAVWEVIMIAREYKMDVEKTAQHLDWPMHRVQAAFNYFEAFTDEIEVAIKDNASYDFERIKAMLPQAVLYTVRETGAATVVKEKSGSQYPRKNKTKRK